MLKKSAIEELREAEKQYKANIMSPVWFAAMENGKDDEDWGYGSFDIVDAVEMALDFRRGGYIAVIADGRDPICEEEFWVNPEWEVTPMYAGDGKEALAKDWICDKKAIDGVFEVMEVAEDGSNATVREVIFMDDPEDGRHDLDSAELTITAKEMKQMRHF